jgi:ATP-dependent DNA ligase
MVQNLEEARAKFMEYFSAGFEGIILKDTTAIWENKRSKSLIKFKGELECDLKVVGWEEGTGKNVGKLGALVCESADGIIKVNVGSGFNDEDRGSIKAENVIGKIVAVKYNARIKNKSEGATESLFLPIFLEIREDKTQADSTGSIK